jgi:hypothetical protein
MTAAWCYAMSTNRTGKCPGLSPAFSGVGYQMGKFCDDDRPSERPAKLPKADLVHHLSSSGELRD